MKFIDLFAGAGGLSEGFIEMGFEPVIHVELDSHACNTLETRLIYHKLKKENQLEHYYKYLKGNITRETFIEKYGNKQISNSILNKEIGKDNKYIFDQIDKNLQNHSIDLIIGGPPCQAYSLVGRARDKNNMKNDPRNFLYIEYGKFLQKYTPKVFVFENVIGLITANKGKYFKDMQSYFKQIGYHIDYQIQNSEHFGVLQKRKRIILIGWQKKLNFQYPNFDKHTYSFNIRDILSDLKKLKPGEENNITNYTKKPNDYLKQFSIRTEQEPFATLHITRPHNERDLKIYNIAIKKWLDKKERLKYPDLPEELKTHKNQKSFLDRYKVVDIFGLSHTMVAHIAKDGHHYIYPDKNQVRSLSVREAARIQSFPDNYYFEGGRSAAFKQIGNAVPPLMSKEIAKKIKELLCQKN